MTKIIIGGFSFGIGFILGMIIMYVGSLELVAGIGMGIITAVTIFALVTDYDDSDDDDF